MEGKNSCIGADGPVSSLLICKSLLVVVGSLARLTVLIPKCWTRAQQETLVLGSQCGGGFHACEGTSGSSEKSGLQQGALMTPGTDRIAELGGYK